MKQWIKRAGCLLVGTALAVTSLAGCTKSDKPSNNDSASSSAVSNEAIDIRMAVIKGPTGVGAVNLWANQDNGEARNRYTFETVTTPDLAVNKIANGDVDIAALPTNAAAALYAKTNGNIQVLAVNTLGVLYMLENGDSIQSVADLKGKTIYSTGQGANPEYILNYILEQNGLTPGKDVTIQFVAENDELAALLVKGTATVAMVPEPVATTVRSKNDKLRVALSMSDEWDAVAGEDSALMMGCIVGNKDFVAAHPDGIRTFLQEYEASIERANAVRDDTAKLCKKYGIIDDETIAERSIVGCNLVFIEGDKMKDKLTGYYNVLLKANPKSIGGKLPDDAFYYLGETA